MSRPHKATVDYFPHYCSSGKTLYILESKYGNDGYAFWFKLLELLAHSEGHYYDYNEPANWQFLLAKTCVSEDTANNILATLSVLNAIDKDLAQNHIIWVQNFVNNIADVYKRRQFDLPQKPNHQKPSRQAKKERDHQIVERLRQEEAEQGITPRTKEEHHAIICEAWGDSLIEETSEGFLIQVEDKELIRGDTPIEVHEEAMLKANPHVFDHLEDIPE